MLSVTGFARQCFCLHLWEQLTGNLSRTSEDRHFINKALHQKAKDETDRTVCRTWSYGDYVKSTDVFWTQSSSGLTEGHGKWWIQILEIYGQFISFPRMLIFLTSCFPYTAFSCYVGHSKGNRSSNSTSGYIPKGLKAGTARNICIPMFAAILFAVAKKQRQPKCPVMDE